MPASCDTSTQCFTVMQGCTSGSAIQCGTVITNCNITSVVFNCPNYTNSSDCANRTFYPACNNTSVNTPGYPVCYATGVGGNCNPTLTPGCQMWTMGSVCDTSAGVAYCQALSVAQNTAGCTAAAATGNCDVTFASA